MQGQGHFIRVSLVNAEKTESRSAPFIVTAPKAAGDDLPVAELPRLIILHRWESGLGFTTTGTFVSRIAPGTKEAIVEALIDVAVLKAGRRKRTRDCRLVIKSSR